MHTVSPAAKASPGLRFHWRFALAMAAAGIVIVANVASIAWQSFFGNPTGWYGKTIESVSAILFTYAVIGIMRLRAEAKHLDFDHPALLDRLEKASFVSFPGFTTFLLWAAVSAFFVAMFHHNEPAIFLLAVIAIYVAAEHLSGLYEHRQILVEQRRVLGDFKRALESMANATGIEHGREELYGAYASSASSTKPILAVIKSFDIDREWFDVGGDIDAYKQIRRTRTFYNALEHANGVLFVSALKIPRQSKLTGLPRPSATELADQFNNLLGLAWQWWMLQEIAAGRPPEQRADFCIRIASTSNWIHVANNHVYQLIEGKVLSENKVRDLTFDIDKRKEALASLVDWAEKEIRRTAERACRGEEYLCATVYSLLHTITTSEFDYVTERDLATVLKVLGMEEWIARKSDYVAGLALDGGRLEMQCCAIFKHFLQAVAKDDRRAITLSSNAIANRRKAWEDIKVPESICPVTDIAYEVY